MPAGCVYFVSFYITRYPRDLDSIYFLLALRLECTRPIFDVGGRIFSERNDRWIFLYFHSRLTRFFSHPERIPSPSSSRSLFRREILLRLTATSRSVRADRELRAKTTRNSICIQQYREITQVPHPLQAPAPGFAPFLFRPFRKPSPVIFFYLLFRSASPKFD